MYTRQKFNKKKARDKERKKDGSTSLNRSPAKPRRSPSSPRARHDKNRRPDSGDDGDGGNARGESRQRDSSSRASKRERGSFRAEEEDNNRSPRQHRSGSSISKRDISREEQEQGGQRSDVRRRKGKARDREESRERGGDRDLESKRSRDGDDGSNWPPSKTSSQKDKSIPNLVSVSPRRSSSARGNRETGTAAEAATSGKQGRSRNKGDERSDEERLSSAISVSPKRSPYAHNYGGGAAGRGKEGRRNRKGGARSHHASAEGRGRSQTKEKGRRRASRADHTLETSSSERGGVSISPGHNRGEIEHRRRQDAGKARGGDRDGSDDDRESHHSSNRHKRETKESGSVIDDPTSNRPKERRPGSDAGKNAAGGEETAGASGDSRRRRGSGNRGAHQPALDNAMNDRETTVDPSTGVLFGNEQTAVNKRDAAEVSSVEAVGQTVIQTAAGRDALVSSPERSEYATRKNMKGEPEAGEEPGKTALRDGSSRKLGSGGGSMWDNDELQVDCGETRLRK